jgi:hypothetical protein
MRLWLLVVLVAGTLTSAPAQKKKAPKPPEVEVTEAMAQRQEGRVSLDVRLRNCGEKPIRKLVLLFDFLDAGNKVVTTKKGGIDQDILAPGEDVEFHGQVEDNSRAVAIRARFEDADERDLRLVKDITVTIE